MRVIRQFRPDVIVTRFSPTPGGTHGHHTASAVLAVEAFALANNPDSFADELGHLAPWQPKRVVWNAWRRGGPGFPNALTLDVGGYNAVRGESFGEIAARSRSEHRSQGFGAVGTRGSATEQFVHLEGEPAASDLMDDVSDRWSRLEGGKEIAAQLNTIIAGFDPRQPGRSVSALLEVRRAMSGLPAGDMVVAEKHTQLDQILVACLGLHVEATLPQARVAPDEELNLTHTVVMREPFPVEVEWLGVRYLADADGNDLSVGQSLRVNENESMQASRSLPLNTSLSHPYWLELPSTAGMAQVADATLIGTPENQAAYAMIYEFEVGGQTLELPVSPVQVIRDRVRGELRDTLQVIPPVAVSFVGQLGHLALGETRAVTVQATAARGDLSGDLSVAAPDGWKVVPAKQAFTLSSVGDKAEATFAVTAPWCVELVKLAVSASVDGRQFNRTPQVVAYDHIPVQMLQPPATFTAMSFDLEIRGEQVGFLPGAGDTTLEALTLMGYDVRPLTDADLTAEGLADLDAVVLGIRAFNTRPNLMSYREVLWEFVQSGGNVVVQYNTTGGLPQGDLGPYPFRLSRDRVTDETAEVTVLDREHAAMLGPNKITEADFAGWVQERGLYFPSEWDVAYTPLLGMADPGEAQTRGSLLVAQHGEGYFVYTGLSFFRELPAGVPGAYRLLANLISL